MTKKLIRLLGAILNMINFMFPATGGKISYNLFSYPHRKKYTARQSLFLNVAEIKFITYLSGRVPLYRWGSGKRRILLVHGWKSHTYRWKDYIESFDKSKFSVYSIDAPGHGNASGFISNVPLYIEALKAVVETVGKMDIIIGHSVGGFATLGFLHQYPQYQPEKMVSMGAPGNATDFVDFYVKALGLSQKSIKNMTDYFVTVTGKNPEEYALHNIMHNINSKGLIIHDKGDKDVPVKYARIMHELWANSELVLTEGLGHGLKGPLVYEKIIDFID